MASQKIGVFFAVVSRVVFILASQTLSLSLQNMSCTVAYILRSIRDKKHGVKRESPLDLTTL